MLKLPSGLELVVRRARRDGATYYELIETKHGEGHAPGPIGFAVRSIDLQALFDGLVGFLVNHRHVDAPLIPLRTLAARYRSLGGQTRNADHVTLAHILADLDHALRTRDEAVIRGLEAAAVRRSIARGDTWGAAVARTRIPGKPDPAGAEGLRKIAHSILRESVADRQREVETMNEERVAEPRHSKSDGFDAVAESLTFAVRHVLPQLGHGVSKGDPTEDMAHWLREETSGVEAALGDLDAADAVKKAIRLLGATTREASDFFKYLGKRRKKARSAGTVASAARAPRRTPVR
ncbi:MAG: hypothetical protein WCJ30_10775 [Deltaproteobacteria bacterium]